jgi:hypothetical protein
MFRWPLIGDDGSDAWDATETLQPADEEPVAKPRPSTVDKLYVEEEYEERASAQPDAYRAVGIQESRRACERAAGEGHAACEAIAASNRASGRAQDATERGRIAAKALKPYRRRPGDAKAMKYIRMVALFVGDGGATFGAIKLLGEEPVYAAFQAISVAMAAITLGLVGREWKHMQAARARMIPFDQLTDEQRIYASHFNGYARAGWFVIIVAMACAAGTASIATGIYALRSATDGEPAALAWLGFAVAFGIASFVNAYDTADEIADVLDEEDSAIDRAEEKAAKVRRDDSIRAHAEAEAERDAIVEQRTAEGKAAQKEVKAKLYKVLGDNPKVAGHGTPPLTLSDLLRMNGHNPDQLKIKGVG